MTKQVQRRRGTNTQHTGFTGADGEISVNTTNKSIHVHDGATAGGFEAARADLLNVDDADVATAISGGTVSSLTITSADINGGTIDGTTIGANSATAGTFTTLSATTLGSAVDLNSQALTNANIDSGAIDGTVIGANSSAAITGTTITGTSFVSSGDMTFGDNDKAIFGAGSDLQIYHDGANSVIDDTGGGRLYLRSDPGVIISKYTGEVCAQFNADDDVKLYYDDALKFATTSTGVDVTGTVTADDTLKIDGTQPQIILDETDASTTHSVFSAGGSLYVSADSSGVGSKNIVFRNNGTTERMRIDSSGHLLVGTTTGGGTIGTYNGFGAFSGGNIFSSATSTRSIFARRSTDGDIIEFRKDSTTVGSVESYNGNLRIKGGTTATTEFKSNGNVTFYGQINNQTDNTYDIGWSGGRFKDLYLSGGVYLGGTGSANYLDDYEEGTWTPVFDGQTTSPTSPTSGDGKYTKIGNQVILYGVINNISVSGGSGNVIITGLPFTCSSGVSGGNIPGTLYANSLLFPNANDQYAVVEAFPTTSNLYIRMMQANATAKVLGCNTTHFVEGTTDIRFQVTYRTA